MTSSFSRPRRPKSKPCAGWYVPTWNRPPTCGCLWWSISGSDPTGWMPNGERGWLSGFSAATPWLGISLSRTSSPSSTPSRRGWSRPTPPSSTRSRQSWQSVGLHPEVRSAWEQRERFRPPGSSRLALPPLPAPSAIEVDDLTLRRAAYARVRTASRDQGGDEAPGPKRSIVALALALGLMTLAVLGWAIVSLAIRVSVLANGWFAVGNKR